MAGTPPPADICTGNYFYQSFCNAEWRVSWPGAGGPPGLIDGQGCGNHARMWRDLLGRVIYIVGQGPGGERYPYPDQAVDPEGFEFFRALYQPITPEEKETQDSWVRQGYSSLLLGRLGGTQNPKLKPLSAVPEPQHTTWSNQFHCMSRPVVYPADWAEQLYREGITAGCGPAPGGINFCPDSPLTRAQAAVWILKAIHGKDYVPPPCTGIFNDCPCPLP